jgi:hypothetical protein
VSRSTVQLRNPGCCEEAIDAYGCACSPSHAWPALSNRTGWIGLNPDNWPDDVGVAEDGRVQGIREAR